MTVGIDVDRRVLARPDSLTRATRFARSPGDYEIIEDFVIDDWLQMKLDKTQEELVGERSCVSHLIPESRRRSPPACDIKEDTMLPGEK